jgi:hypothetical protein
VQSHSIAGGHLPNKKPMVQLDSLNVGYKFALDMWRLLSVPYSRLSAPRM